MNHARLWIDGEWRDALAGTVAEVISPATGEVVGAYADAGVADGRQAVAAARLAFEGSAWSRSPKLRAATLLGLGMALYFSFQGTGRMVWPLACVGVRMSIIVIGCTLASRAFGFGVDSLFAVTAGALLAFGAMYAWVTAQYVAVARIPRKNNSESRHTASTCHCTV